MYIPLRRIGVYFVAFLFAIVVNFTVPRLMPGSPVDGMIAQLGPRATRRRSKRSRRASARSSSRSAAVRRLSEGARHLRSRRLGEILSADRHQVLASSAGWTALLVTGHHLFPLRRVSLGAVAAWRRGGRFDAFVSPFSVVLIAMPPVIIALATLFTFGVTLRWFPVGYA